ncbi:MAG: hypothetical protein JWL84_5992 [Rhodospirillales bacterium]|nr:hypothetical protein [Rhodospirillales bacterium]
MPQLRIRPMTRLYWAFGDALEADANGDHFNDEFLKTICEQAKDKRVQWHKGISLAVDLSAILFLLLQGVRFPVVVYGAKLDEMPGSVEVLLIVTSLIGLSACLSHLRMAALDTMISAMGEKKNIKAGRRFYMAQFDESFDFFLEIAAKHTSGAVPSKNCVWAYYSQPASAS